MLKRLLLKYNFVIKRYLKIEEAYIKIKEEFFKKNLHIYAKNFNSDEWHKLHSMSKKLILDDPEVTPNIYCKSRSLPNRDTQNYSTDLR